MNKTGSFADMLYLMVFLFLCGIVLSVGWLIYSRINTEWQTHTELGTESLQIMQNTTDKYVETYDGIFLVLMIGLYLGALILAYNVDINPIYFFLSLFMVAVIGIVAAVLGNAWYMYANNGIMSEYVNDFTIIPFVMANYVQILVVMTFGLVAVMYAKTRG